MPSTFLLLCSQRAGELVSKDELLERAWAGLVVEENNLQVQVSVLRKVLGAQAIATIPGRGYRFALSVSCDDSLVPSAQSANVAGKAAPSTSNTDLPPLYGRAADLAVLNDMIVANAIVTIVGPAGIGKTRLAEAAAHDLSSAFPDGVQFVEFAQLADPALVTITVSRALGIAVGTRTPRSTSRFTHRPADGCCSSSTIASICWRPWIAWFQPCARARLACIFSPRARSC